MEQIETENWFNIFDAIRFIAIFFCMKRSLRKPMNIINDSSIEKFEKNVLKSKQNLHKYNKICKIIGTMKDAIIASERS